MRAFVGLLAWLATRRCRYRAAGAALGARLVCRHSQPSGAGGAIGPARQGWAAGAAARGGAEARSFARGTLGPAGGRGARGPHSCRRLHAAAMEGAHAGTRGPLSVAGVGTRARAVSPLKRT